MNATAVVDALDANVDDQTLARQAADDALDQRLRTTVRPAMSWQSAATVLVQLVQGATSLLIAAAVGPQRYGIWAIAAMLFNTQYLLAGLGLGPALIYYKHDRDRYQDAVDGAFITTVALGVAGAAIFWIATPLFAQFFAKFAYDNVVRVTQWMSIVFLCTTLANVPTALMERTLDFRRRAIPDIVAVLTYAVLVWILYLNGAGVWSLVYGRAAQTVLLAAMYWWLAPTKPRFPPRMKTNVVMQLLHYGKFMSAAAITGFLISNLDNATIGHFYGDKALGAYALAYTVTNLAPTFMTLTVGKVSFPLYTAIRGDARSMRRVFAVAVHYLSVAMLPTTAALIAVAPAVISAVSHGNWALAAPLVPILAVYGLARAMNAAGSTLLAAAGRPEVGAWLPIPTMIVTAILWLLVFRMGAIGVALAFTGGQLATAAISIYMTRDYWSTRLLRRILPALTASVVAVGVERVVSHTLSSNAKVLVVAFAVAYAIVLIILDRHVRAIVFGRPFERPMLARDGVMPAGARAWRVVYFGLYTDDYPRNNMMRRGLRSLGVEVVECRAPTRFAPSHVQGTSGRGLGMKRFPFEVRELWLGLARLWSVLWQFTKVRGPVDAIVLAEFNQSLSPIASILAAMRGSALIMDFTMSQYDTAVNDRRALKPWKPRAVWRWLMDAASIHLSDRVLVETGPIAEQYATLFGGMRNKACVSHIGAPEWRFFQRPLVPRGDRPLNVLYYGNYVPLHGVEFIVQAAQRLKDDPRFKFTMVGAGQSRAAAVAAYNANPSGNLEFLGRATDDELDQLLADSDICLGIFGTSMKARLLVSNKVWQCLATGRPVITGNGPGAASVLRSGDHCLLVPHGDPGGIVQALRQLADDPAMSDRLAENGAKLVQQQFTSTTVARGLIGAINDVQTARLAAADVA